MKKISKFFLRLVFWSRRKFRTNSKKNKYHIVVFFWCNLDSTSFVVFFCIVSQSQTLPVFCWGSLGICFGQMSFQVSCFTRRLTVLSHQRKAYTDNRLDECYHSLGSDWSLILDFQNKKKKKNQHNMSNISWNIKHNQNPEPIKGWKRNLNFFF